MMRSEKRPGQNIVPPPRRKTRRKRERHVGYAILTFFMLLIVYPAGLVMLWVRKLKWFFGTKLLVSLATAPVFFLLMAFALTAPVDDPLVVSAQTAVREGLTTVTETISAAIPAPEVMKDNLLNKTPRIAARLGEIALAEVKGLAATVQGNLRAVIGDETHGGLLAALRDKAYQAAGKTPPGAVQTPPSQTPGLTTLPPDQTVYVVPGSGVYHLDPACEVEGDLPLPKADAVAEGDQPCELCAAMDLKTPVPVETAQPVYTPIPVATLAPSQSPEASAAFLNATRSPDKTASVQPTATQTPDAASTPLVQVSRPEAPQAEPTLSTPTATVTPSPTGTPQPTQAPVPSSTPVAEPVIQPIGEMTVYYFDSSKYYHTRSSCGSMKSAPSHTLKEGIESGKSPCPGCKPLEASILQEERVVYCGTDDVFHLSDKCEAITKTWLPKPFNEAWLEDGMAGCPVCGADLLIEYARQNPESTPVPAPVAADPSATNEG